MVGLGKGGVVLSVDLSRPLPAPNHVNQGPREDLKCSRLVLEQPMVVGRIFELFVELGDPAVSLITPLCGYCLPIGRPLMHGSDIRREGWRLGKDVCLHPAAANLDKLDVRSRSVIVVLRRCE